MPIIYQNEYVGASGVQSQDDEKIATAELLKYNPQMGIFTWRTDKARAKAGSRAFAGFAAGNTGRRSMHGSRVVPALIGCIISVLSFDIRSICAAEQGPKVVVDSWWSGAGCDECAYRLQDSVMSQIAIDPSCHGITVTRAYGPEDKNGEAILPALSRWWRQSGGKPHWMLLIDYIGSAYWQLFYQEDIDKIGESGIIPGEHGDKAAKIAHDACAIILQRGGTIIR